MLELRQGSIITGNVVAVSGGSDTLRLGGNANASFDASQIGAGAQYRNFATLEKTGSSNWTVTGAPVFTGAVTVTSGTMTLSGADFSLASRMTVNGTLDISGNGSTFHHHAGRQRHGADGQRQQRAAHLRGLDRVFRRHQ